MTSPCKEVSDEVVLADLLRRLINAALSDRQERFISCNISVVWHLPKEGLSFVGGLNDSNWCSFRGANFLRVRNDF